MIRFVVVEDGKNYQEQIRSIIRKLTFDSEQDIEILMFSYYSKELEKVIKDCSERKIYILDIELESKISGIQIAQRIREKDWDSDIVFVTNHDKQFENVYRNVYIVFDFIEKFHDFDKRLDHSLKVILSNKHDNKMLRYHSRHADLQLFLKDITYIYRDTAERKLVVCTTNNKYTINKTITDIEKELDDRFQIVHRACIVNKDRVTKYKWSSGSFILDTREEVFLLSKKYKSEVIKK